VNKWVKLLYSQFKLVRYADGSIVYCNTNSEFSQIFISIKQALSECGLTDQPEKMKLVYCMKSGRNLKRHIVSRYIIGEITCNPCMIFLDNKHINTYYFKKYPRNRGGGVMFFRIKIIYSFEITVSISEKYISLKLDCLLF